MAAQRGFCPYCAHVNPPDFKFCVNCKKKLPPEVLGIAAGGPPTKEDLDEAAGGEPPLEPEPTPPKSARWVILVLTIGIALVVLVASVGLLTHFLKPTSDGSAPITGNFVRSDLCQNTSGVDCKGSQIEIPYLAGNELKENVTQCYAIYPTGNSPRLWLNFTTNSRILGVLIPESLYNGANVSYLSNPAGFYNSSSEVSQAAWNSGTVLGGDLVNQSIPSSTSGWCLAWWDPGYPGTVTLTADVYLLSAAPP
jgi:hypothetical protein